MYPPESVKPVKQKAANPERRRKTRSQRLKLPSLKLSQRRHPPLRQKQKHRQPSHVEAEPREPLLQRPRQNDKPEPLNPLRRPLQVAKQPKHPRPDGARPAHEQLVVSAIKRKRDRDLRHLVCCKVCFLCKV